MKKYKKSLRILSLVFILGFTASAFSAHLVDINQRTSPNPNVNPVPGFEPSPPEVIAGLTEKISSSVAPSRLSAKNFNGVNQQAKKSCGCCAYFHNAEYGAKYNTDGKFLESGSKEWCLKARESRLVQKRNEYIQRTIASGAGQAFISIMEIRLATATLKKHIQSSKATKAPGATLLKDLKRFEGNSAFTKSLSSLVYSSHGLTRTSGDISYSSLQTMWGHYKTMVENAPQSFLDNPPASAMAYQNLFDVLNEVRQEKVEAASL